jgi:hypothetical protein
MTFRAEPFQGAESNEAVTGSHVQNGVIGSQLGLVEHLVADRVQELGEILLACLGITTETHVQQPLVPAVRSLRHNSAFCPPQPRMPADVPPSPGNPSPAQPAGHALDPQPVVATRPSYTT